MTFPAGFIFTAIILLIGNLFPLPSRNFGTMHDQKAQSKKAFFSFTTYMSIDILLIEIKKFP